MERNLKCCYGISSFAHGKDKHIFMMDFDNVSFWAIIEDLKRIQHFYNLSDLYIIKSTNGWNVLSFDKLNLKTIYEVGIDSILTDRDFVLYGYDRGYYVLRFDKDKKLEKILKSKYNVHEKSLAHKEFIEFFFDIVIEHDDLFDKNQKFDIIQYPSDKNGYHEVKKW